VTRDSSSRWSIAVAVAVALAGLPWFCGYLLPQRGSVTLGLAALAGYAPLPTALLLALGVGLRLRAAVAVAGVLLVAEVVSLAPLYVGDGRPSASRPRLRVLTVNMFFGEADAGRIATIVRERRVDVLALEELTPDAVQRLSAAGLDDALPHAIVRAEPGARGTGLWSRFPLEEVSTERLGTQSCAGDLHVDGRTVRVRAVHPLPPVPAGPWHRDFLALRRQAARDVGVATVILGDFNASVHHDELRRLMGGRWRDAAEVDGAGLVRTWSPHRGVPALLDPDHVLVDHGMAVVAWDTVGIRGSDHHGVLAEVAL
jgi:endonuclease/exonuclease/phosphatase (EEP) superfamily protein YafD